MNPEYILRGAVHSFHSAWSFLRDGVLIYRNARYSSACVLGTIAAEHLGQCQWLLRTWQRATEHSPGLDRRKFIAELKRYHPQMLKDGLVTLEYGAPKHLADLGIRFAKLKPGDPDYSSVADEYMKSHEKIWKKAPAKFYDLRISAQYVKPTDDCKEWKSPAAVGSVEVHDLLLNVGNCYRFLLYLRFLKEPPLVKGITEMGVKKTLEDVKSTWPPPEGDAFER